MRITEAPDRMLIEQAFGKPLNEKNIIKKEFKPYKNCL